MLATFHSLSRATGNLAFWALLFAIAWLADPHIAHAQAITSYVRTDDGAVGRDQVCNASPLVRTFNVTDTFVVGDVDLGVIVDHSWRGDVQITLESPNGTRVQLVDGNINTIEGNNFHVLLNDEGDQLVNTDDPQRNQSGSNTPPFQNDYIPNSALSAFDGQSSNGTWTMEICDRFPGADDGAFRYAELFLTSAPSNIADLSLTKVLIGPPPVNGGNATWRLTATNAANSQATANGVVVRDTLPASFTFGSATGTGAFNAANGNWTIGTLAPGQSVSIEITGRIDAPGGTSVTNVAEIIASSAVDPDSTVNNAATSEDDYASVAFTVSATTTATPPTLPCPVGSIRFDWDAVSWTPGSLNNTYQLAGYGSIGFTIANNGNFVSRASFGGDVPRLSDAVSGGLSPTQQALAFNMDNDNTSQQAVTTITLPRAFSAAQFAVFDIDRSATFQDRVTVYGRLSGVRVEAILTPGAANSAAGDALIGSSGAGDTTAQGTGVFTFLSSIDTIVIEYGNGADAPANPSNQSIAIHDFDFCVPPSPEISVTKVSTVISDPFNGSVAPKAIPGAMIEYIIAVTNSANGATDTGSVVITDLNPADIQLCQLTRVGGPVVINDPANASGLSFSFGGLGSGTDSLEFTTDGGASFGYTPINDGAGCDANVTGFRLRPGGAMAGNSSFELRVRYQVLAPSGPTP